MESYLIRGHKCVESYLIRRHKCVETYLIRRHKRVEVWRQFLPAQVPPLDNLLKNHQVVVPVHQLRRDGQRFFLVKRLKTDLYTVVYFGYHNV